jgi:SAM-dependent methyltransferase
MGDAHAVEAPSDWVCRFAPLIEPAGSVLDLACGSGRHSRYLAGLGYQVVAVDRDPEVVELLDGEPGIKVELADLEGAAWPYDGRKFAGIVVTNYLHRPLNPYLLASLGPGGVLIYETFATGNERYGRPRNPDFLLRPGELLEMARGRLRVMAYEDLYTDTPRPAVIQRLCALLPAPA